MKSKDVLDVLGQELGTSDLAKLNQALKAKGAQGVKFKIQGAELGPLGYTVAIKIVTAEGLKVFDIGRVRLIRFDEIESIAKAKPRVKREKPAKVEKPEKTQKKQPSVAKNSEDAAKGPPAFDKEAKPPKKKPSVRGSAVIPARFRNSIR